MESVKDILIIGGGINGTGIAADAAGRGLSVILCEKGDLASGTSSASTKLIHGGLRYLEQHEFSLVRHALRESEILLKKAPHLITPLEFVLPHSGYLRPAWMIRVGLFLYDHLSKRKFIPRSKSLNFSKDTCGSIIKKQFKKGFSYFDFFTDDARLVIENCISAHENKAEILTHTEFLSARRINNIWHINLINQVTGDKYTCFAKALINTAGPWVQEVNNKIEDNNTRFSVQLVKGSHILVPKLYEGNFAWILQNPDKRIVFALPFCQHFTLIGTTDDRVEQPEKSDISECEKTYLLDSINSYFKKSVSRDVILWSYSGIRCLQDENHSTLPSAITRNYKILLEDSNYTAPLLTVIGGKLTTFRELSEEVVDKLVNYFPKMGPAWTAHTPFPGGNLGDENFDKFYNKIKKEYYFLPDELVYRYTRNYGARVKLLLCKVNALNDLGEHFGAGLYQREIDFLMQYEWAKSVDDILWRRTKLGLYLTNGEKETLRKKFS